MTHTKKPWSAFTDDSRDPPHTNIVAYDGGTKCVFSLPGRHKNEPDVALACAAPDLLEALEAAIDLLQLYATGDDQFTVERACAAIAKAKGGDA